MILYRHSVRTTLAGLVLVAALNGPAVAAPPAAVPLGASNTAPPRALPALAPPPAITVMSTMTPLSPPRDLTDGIYVLHLTLQPASAPSAPAGAQVLEDRVQISHAGTALKMTIRDLATGLSIEAMGANQGGRLSLAGRDVRTQGQLSLSGTLDAMASGATGSATFHDVAGALTANGQFTLTKPMVVMAKMKEYCDPRYGDCGGGKDTGSGTSAWGRLVNFLTGKW